jgi:hypothetical protein
MDVTEHKQAPYPDTLDPVLGYGVNGVFSLR